MPELKTPPKQDFGALLDAIVHWSQTVGVRLPNTTAHLAKVVGSLVFSTIDMVAGSMALSWIFTQLTPKEFLVTAKVLAWGLSIGLFFVVRTLVDDKDGVWWRGPSLFGWGLNIADSFIDASVAFILFGQASFLIQPGFSAFKASVTNMPFIGWFVWALIFVISLTSEHWREAMQPSAPGSTDPHDTSGSDAAHHGTDPATPTDHGADALKPAGLTPSACYTEGPGGEKPPAADKYYFPYSPPPHWYSLAEAAQNGTKGMITQGKAPVVKPTEPGEEH